MEKSVQESLVVREAHCLAWHHDAEQRGAEVGNLPDKPPVGFRKTQVFMACIFESNEL